MIQIAKAFVTPVVSATTTFHPLAGFQVVTSAVNVAEENLFTFSGNTKLCLHFKSEDCNGLTYTCTAYRMVKGVWVNTGKHKFDKDGNCRTMAVDWNQVVLAQRD